MIVDKRLYKYISEQLDKCFVIHIILKINKIDNKTNIAVVLASTFLQLGCFRLGCLLQLPWVVLPTSDAIAAHVVLVSLVASVKATVEDNVTTSCY